jgi:hypothetical protein
MFYLTIITPCFLVSVVSYFNHKIRNKEQWICNMRSTYPWGSQPHPGKDSCHEIWRSNSWLLQLAEVSEEGQVPCRAVEPMMMMMSTYQVLVFLRHKLNVSMDFSKQLQWCSDWLHWRFTYILISHYFHDISKWHYKFKNLIQNLILYYISFVIHKQHSGNKKVLK